MKRRDNRTRQQKKADISTCIGSVCFLIMLALAIAYMVVDAA